MGLLDFMPLPTFRIDRQLNVLECSESAIRHFGKQAHLEAIVDEGSRRKLAKLQEQSAMVEMALLTAAFKLKPYSMSVQWSGNEAVIQCVEINPQVERLEQLVHQQQTRLAEADFQLMEKKEEAEQALVKMKERSAPLISLNSRTALIPMFGDLDNALMEQTKEKLIRHFYDGGFEQLYIDFTAVDSITLSGIKLFKALIDTLMILDAEIHIVGIKPEHAPFLKDQEHEEVTYSGTIQLKSESLYS
ncbi:STAS domain-containing protein [Domibacillus indicus]|uniref:STAS domain-containing protein n=1 Tax=Domibacillus indicus TaxID=1437523 RepID=UPI0006182B95|nr:STAS domain-containing protein [Domibacillus indicus]